MGTFDNPATYGLYELPVVEQGRGTGVARPVLKVTPRPVYVYVLANVLGMSLEAARRVEVTPPAPVDLLGQANRIHALPVYAILWRRSVLRRVLTDTELPVVYVHAEDRNDFGLDRKTVAVQINRLVKAGLIEVVERRSGLATRVRLVKRRSTDPAPSDPAQPAA